MLIKKIALLTTNKFFDIAQVYFWASETVGINDVYRMVCARALARLQADPKASVYDAAVLEGMDLPAAAGSQLLENQRQMALILVEMAADPKGRAERLKDFEEATKKFFMDIFMAKNWAPYSVKMRTAESVSPPSAN